LKGETGGSGQDESRQIAIRDGKEDPTGVKSRSESASVADVAASIKSSHLLPIAAAAAAPGGSAEKAFLPSMLILRV